MSYPNPIFYNPQLQTLRCRGCMERFEIPARVYRDTEALAILREGFEHQHVAQGCDVAMVKTKEVEYRPDPVTALRAAWGLR